MNKRPVSYLQTDKRWAKTPYQVAGEHTDIAESGCGPTCAAMVIETLTGRTCTPKDTCAWSVAHGYKALGQGTYYSYFAPQFSAYGIECRQLLPSRIINQPAHPVHEQVLEYLRQGYYVIALMGPGTWTKGGHFVLVWDWDDMVRINDPASTRPQRLNGDPDTFRREVRCYWLVDARAYNNGDDDMDQKKFDEMLTVALTERQQERRDNDSSQWSQDARDWAVKSGIINGSGTLPDGQPNMMWEDILTREQLVTVLYRFAQQYGLT